MVSSNSSSESPPILTNQDVPPSIGQSSGKHPSPPVQFVNSSPSIRNELLHSKLLVLGILFGVTGVLGLPLLWMSRAFSTQEKMVWSVINTIYTTTLVVGTWMIVRWAWRAVEEYQQML